MEEKLVVQLKNKKALKLLQSMEELDLIKLSINDSGNPEKKISEKYRNVFTKGDASSFDDHTKTMRKEWNNI